jgi:hypothetical protein
MWFCPLGGVVHRPCTIRGWLPTGWCRLSTFRGGGFHVAGRGCPPERNRTCVRNLCECSDKSRTPRVGKRTSAERQDGSLGVLMPRFNNRSGVGARDPSSAAAGRRPAARVRAQGSSAVRSSRIEARSGYGTRRAPAGDPGVTAGEPPRQIISSWTTFESEQCFERCGSGARFASLTLLVSPGSRGPRCLEWSAAISGRSASRLRGGSHPRSMSGSTSSRAGAVAISIAS